MINDNKNTKILLIIGITLIVANIIMKLIEPDIMWWAAAVGIMILLFAVPLKFYRRQSGKSKTNG